MASRPTLRTMSPRPPADLPALVRAAFARARAGGHLTFYPTRVALLRPTPAVSSPPFQLRFSPALAAKPRHARPHGAAAPAENPFANPSPDLLVAVLGDTHRLVLNKFAVVPEHFILATREFQPQTHVLEERDLTAAYACVDAYAAGGEGGQDGEREGGGSGENGGPGHGHGEGEPHDGEGTGEGEGLFVFFNSGPHSGASQPHRHLQLLPIARMRDGLVKEQGEGGEGGWTVLADELGGSTAAGLAFETFHAAISPAMTPAQLHHTYLSLLCRAVRAVDAYRRGAREEGQEEQEQEDVVTEAPPAAAPQSGEEAPISYNLAMTARSLVVCPRLSEGAVLALPSSPGTGDGRGEEGIAATLSINGAVLAGTALVKGEAEWEALRANGGATLRRILGQIGVPRTLS